MRKTATLTRSFDAFSTSSAFPSHDAPPLPHFFFLPSTTTKKNSKTVHRPDRRGGGGARRLRRVGRRPRRRRDRRRAAGGVFPAGERRADAGVGGVGRLGPVTSTLGRVTSAFYISALSVPARHHPGF